MKTPEEIEENMAYLRKKYWYRREQFKFRDFELLHQIDLLEWVLKDSD